MALYQALQEIKTNIWRKESAGASGTQGLSWARQEAHSRRQRLRGQVYTNGLVLVSALYRAEAMLRILHA